MDIWCVAFSETAYEVDVIKPVLTNNWKGNIFCQNKMTKILNQIWLVMSFLFPSTLSMSVNWQETQGMCFRSDLISWQGDRQEKKSSPNIACLFEPGTHFESLSAILISLYICAIPYSERAKSGSSRHMSACYILCSIRNQSISARVDSSFLPFQFPTTTGTGKGNNDI